MITDTMTEDTNYMVTATTTANPYDDDGSTDEVIKYCDDLRGILQWLMDEDFNYLLSASIICCSK